MKRKLTDWYPPHIKPVRMGWYHTGFRDFDPRNGRCESGYNWYWDGHNWGFYPGAAGCPAQDRFWRGLTQPHTTP